MISLLDLSAAFDTIDHGILVNRLNQTFGIRDTALSWFSSYLKDRTQAVKIGDACSEEVLLPFGVPQGSVLGPILFLVMINDLPDCVKSIVRLFADDCVLYRCINNFEDCLILQNDLKCLEKWAEDWGMRFNAKKCYI